MKSNAKKTAFGGLLSAFAVAISFLETLLPYSPLLPVGVKVGFSNVASMLAVKNISVPYGLTVCLVKSIFVLAVRGVTAFILSLSGGVLSCLAVAILFSSKKSRFGCIGAGVAGAFVHNVTQVSIYSLIVGSAVFYYLPVLVLFGTISGVLTGLTLFYTEIAIKKHPSVFGPTERK